MIIHYTRKLPIFKNYNILKNGNFKKLKKYDKLCLSFIIPHGSTDIYIYPINEVLKKYLITFACMNYCSYHLKHIFLMLFSIYHIRNDIFAYKIQYSIFIHTIFLFFPSFSLTYLAWIHTIIHYFKIIPQLNKIQIISLIFSSIFTYYILNKDIIDIYSKNGLWSSIVIGHILNNK